MKLSGKLVEIKEIQKISDTFKKRSFVVEYVENPQYPEYILFELIQDKCNLLDDYEPGQYIDVNFNLRGRKWQNPEGETRYFTTLQVWQIVPLNQSSDKSGYGSDADNHENDDNSLNRLPF